LTNKRNISACLWVVIFLSCCANERQKPEISHITPELYGLISSRTPNKLVLNAIRLANDVLSINTSYQLRSRFLCDSDKYIKVFEIADKGLGTKEYIFVPHVANPNEIFICSEKIDSLIKELGIPNNDPYYNDDAVAALTIAFLHEVGHIDRNNRSAEKLDSSESFFIKQFGGGRSEELLADFFVIKELRMLSNIRYELDDAPLPTFKKYKMAQIVAADMLSDIVFKMGISKNHDTKLVYEPGRFSYTHIEHGLRCYMIFTLSHDKIHSAHDKEKNKLSDTFRTLNNKLLEFAVEDQVRAMTFDSLAKGNNYEKMDSANKDCFCY